MKNLLSFKGMRNKDPEFFIKALDCYDMYNDLSLIDCFMCVKSKKLKIDIFSFDKKLNQKCNK